MPPSNRLNRRTFLQSGLSVGALAITQPAVAVQPPLISRELWQWARAQQVLEPGAAYFDHAAAGPSLRSVLATEYRTREAQMRLLSSGQAHPATADVHSYLTQLAHFMGCSADELALTRGAGEGLSLAAASLRLQPKDEIVTTIHEHPAALEPWLQKARRDGVTVRQIALPSPISGSGESLGRLVGAVTPATRVLLISHVQYTDGVLMPIRELCQFARERQIISIVDGAQAVGMLNFQLRDLGCDIYAANFHKWMAGAQGTGFLYVRPEVLHRLDALEPRRISLPGPDTAAPAIIESIAMQPATFTMARLSAVLPHAWPAFRGSEAGLNFQTAVRRDRIEARVRELALYARLRLSQLPDLEILTPNAPGTWAGILSLRSPRMQPAELANRLRSESRIVVAAVSWGTGQSALRIAPHIFNTHDEIERLVQAIQRARD